MSDEKKIEIISCEVCGGEVLDKVVDLGSHPMCDDLVRIGDDRRCREYPIEILFCSRCRTAHQRFQIPKRELFPSTYHYRSRFTNDVLSGMSELATHCDELAGGVAGKVVLDIGCNDGSLLDFFKRRGAITAGIEPTDAALEARVGGHRIVQSYLSEESVDSILGTVGHPDVITFTNVFAHIENLNEVILLLDRLMSSTTILVIENHYLGSILNGMQFDTFYHEHPRTYSFTSFKFIAERLGAAVLDARFPRRYGGNIRVCFRKAAVRSEDVIVSGAESIESQEIAFSAGIAGMQREVHLWRQRKRSLLLNLIQEHGPLPAKAFPGRAAILVKLLDFDVNHIRAVYEKPGSMKIGNYVPGTRIPILSDERILGDVAAETPVVNLAWHIADEIKAYLLELGVTSPVVNILESKDFTV